MTAPVRDRRPLVAASVTAVVSIVAMAVAVARGWLGPDVGRGANFCEAARDGLVKQPANTFSNLGFVVAGLLIGAHAGRPGAVGGVLRGRRGLATVVACLVVLLGPASAAMHATQSAVGGELDLLSMYLVAAFAVAYAAARWWGFGAAALAVTFGLALVGCEVVGALDVTLPVLTHPGNAAFATLLITATVLEVLIARRGRTRARRSYAYGSLAAILTAFAIWNATKTWLCAPYSVVQGHAIWHLLDAVSAYLLYRYYASEEPQEAMVTGTTTPRGVPVQA